jgi:hypothetical protein
LRPRLLARVIDLTARLVMTRVYLYASFTWVPAYPGFANEHLQVGHGLRRPARGLLYLWQ